MTENSTPNNKIKATTKPAPAKKSPYLVNICFEKKPSTIKIIPISIIQIKGIKTEYLKESKIDNKNPKAIDEVERYFNIF